MSLKHREHEIRRYLLGDPSQSEEERAAIERSCLEDAAKDDLLEIEDELVDAYVFDRLGSEETALFKEHLKHSERWQEKVEFATALRQYAARRSSDFRKSTAGGRAFQSVQLGYGWAAACGVAVLVVAASLAVYFLRPKPLVERPLPTVATTKQPSNYEAPLKQILAPPAETQKRLAPKTAPGPVLSFVLIPDLVRGRGVQTQVVLPPGRHIVQLRMDRDDEPYRHYEVTLTTPEQRILVHQTGLRPKLSRNARTVILTLPADLLSPGFYILNIKGKSGSGQSEDLDDYTFQVTRH